MGSEGLALLRGTPPAAPSPAPGNVPARSRDPGTAYNGSGDLIAELFFGEFRFDTRGLVLEGPAGPVEVRAKTLQALTYLIAHRDRFVSRDELMQTLWPDVHVTGASVTQCISELRRALDDSARSPRYIETRVKYGYRFVATLYHKPTERLEAPPPPPDADTGSHESRSGWRRWGVLAGAAFLALLLGAVGAWLLSRKQPPGPTILSLTAVATEGSSEEVVTMAREIRKAVVRELEAAGGFVVAPPGREEHTQLAIEITTRTPPSGRLEVVAVLRALPTGRELWGWTWVVPAGDVESTTREVARRIVEAVRERGVPNGRSMLRDGTFRRVSGTAGRESSR